MTLYLNMPYKTKDNQMAIITSFIPDEIDGQVYIGFIVGFDSAEGGSNYVIAAKWTKDGKSIENVSDNIKGQFSFEEPNFINFVCNALRRYININDYIFTKAKGE